MAAALTRLTFVAAKEMEPLPADAKKNLPCNRTKSDMTRELLLAGPDGLRQAEAPEPQPGVPSKKKRGQTQAASSACGNIRCAAAWIAKRCLILSENALTTAFDAIRSGILKKRANSAFWQPDLRAAFSFPPAGRNRIGRLPQGGSGRPAGNPPQDGRRDGFIALSTEMGGPHRQPGMEEAVP